jgi:hypothetical protein
MTALEAFIARHPVRTYFALAFAVSWAGVLLVVGPGGIPTTIEHLTTIGPAMYVAMLMHGSLTATQLILLPPPAPGLSLLTSILAWAATLWIVVAVTAVANGGQFSRPLLWRRAA